MPRRRVALIAVAGAGLTTLTVLGIPIVRNALADRAQEAAVRARAAVVCPDAGAARTVAPVAPPERPGPPLAHSGLVLVSHGGTRAVSILDFSTAQVTRLPAGIGDPHEVAVSPDGRWGIVADFGDNQGDYRFDGRRLAVFDLAAKRLARVIDLGNHRGPHDLAFVGGSSTRLVVTTQTSRHLVEVDVETGRLVAATPTGAAGSHTLAVTADGHTAFTANEPEGSVSRLDLTRRALTSKHPVGPAPAEGIAATPDGREVWVGHRGTGEVRVIDGTTGSLLSTLTEFVTPDRMTMTGDGRRALITDFGCKVVRVVDVASRRVLGTIAGLEGAGVAKVLPDNRVAIVALLDEGAVAVVDLEERRVLARYALGRRLDAAAWGPKP